MILPIRRKACLVIFSSIVVSLCLIVTIFITYSLADTSKYALNFGVQEYTVPADAKDFTLKDINNRNISLKNFRGKIVILNFWATWCGPCRQEMPSMERLHQQFKDRGLVILAIASGDDTKSVNSFITKYNLTFPALIDKDLEVTDIYKVWALPTTYFINSKGQIIGVAQGSRDWNTKEATQYITSIFKASI
ncbi:MAG: hypothetical protein A2Y48_10665 [Nitrospirae bacterium RIFCSPLOW2_12_42_9]|nr:MAG: hypothetical protein A2Y48_10665 [Nitrospirae bacterium RIFCSPLOW2_12_42_9]